MQRLTYLLLLTSILVLSGCEDNTPAPIETESKPQAVAEGSAMEVEQKTAAVQESDGIPPKPPLVEDFQGDPQISLFPRVGDFQPEIDSERHKFWRTFIDHLGKVTGVVEDPVSGNRAWSFRSINSIDSLGYFTPVSVEPGRTYNVSFNLKAELPEGGSAGVGILEFSEFLWVGEQYTEALYQDYYRGALEGKRLTGSIDWEEQQFSFTTGPETRMIHIVLFREGEHNRKGVLFDNIKIE